MNFTKFEAISFSCVLDKCWKQCKKEEADGWIIALAYKFKVRIVSIIA